MLAAVGVGTIVAALVLLAAAQLLGEWLVGDRSSDAASSLDDARNSVFQVVTAVGVFVGLLFTARTYLLTKQTQRAERFTNAVGQLGDEKAETVRAGGAFGLWLLSVEDEQYWPLTEDLLSSLLRERATAGTPLAADTRAALKVLGSRPPSASIGALALEGIHVPGADLVGATLERARLDYACLDDARLTDVRLAGASLAHASLRSAFLARADLRGADLTGADLTDAVLSGADLAHAVLTSATIADADLSGARNVDPRQLAGCLGVPAAPP